MNLYDRLFGKKYEILEKLVEHFDSYDFGPDILFLGDSTVLKASNYDEDKRSTAEMLANDFKGKASVLELSHRAYHMDVFFHLLRTFEITRFKPRLVIIPINMRSFSPQWYLRPNWQFSSEIELLSSYCSGNRLRLYYRKQKSNKHYKKLSVEFPLSNIRTIGEFEALRLNKPDSNVLQEIRKKELFIYFYLYPIFETHPRLIQLRETIRLSKILGCKILYYITPVNIEAADRSVGKKFDGHFSDNLNTVKDVFMEEKGRVLNTGEIEIHQYPDSSCYCVDYSRELGSDCFFHTESIDDHLNQKGRGFIAKSVGEIVQQVLE